MAFDGVTVAVLLIILVSTLVRAVFGFGNALIAMPLLAMTPIGTSTSSSSWSGRCSSSRRLFPVHPVDASSVKRHVL